MGEQEALDFQYAATNKYRGATRTILRLLQFGQAKLHHAPGRPLTRSGRRISRYRCTGLGIFGKVPPHLVSPLTNRQLKSMSGYSWHLSHGKLCRSDVVQRLMPL